MQNLQRVRRYQRELEDAEGRADQAESSLHLIRAKHRSSVVTGKGENDRTNVYPTENFHYFQRSGLDTVCLGGSSPRVYVLEDEA